MKIAAVTTYFDSFGSPVCQTNYVRFRDNILKAGIPLITIEHVMSREAVLASAGEQIVVIRGGSMLWQKERLINLAVEKYLPPDCDAVAWLDADLLLPPIWVKLASSLLQTNVAAQCFQAIIDFNAQGTATGKSVACAARGGGTGSPGGAWVARREFLAKHGLYDGTIVGGGDSTFLDMAFDRIKFDIAQGDSAKHFRWHALKWMTRAVPDIAGRVSFIPIEIFHLWHGDRRKRQYGSRHRILSVHGFNPWKDIAISTSGVWEWASSKPQLHLDVANYFEARAGA